MPTEGIHTSPGWHLMGHHCKTLIPEAGTLLKPSYPTKEGTWAIMGKKHKQQCYHNHHVKPLKPIVSHEAVRINPPGEKSWVTGSCIRQVTPYSYHVKVGDSVYHCNQQDLINAGEPPIADIPENTGSQPTLPASSQPEVSLIPTNPSTLPSPPTISRTKSMQITKKSENHCCIKGLCCKTNYGILFL